MRNGNSRYGNGGNNSNEGNGNGGKKRHSKGGNRRGGGRWKNNNNRRGGGRRYGGRSANQSGNLRERITVESGFMVIIDQFMLANPQFQEELLKLIDQDPSEKDALVEKFGGKVVELAPGSYRILRNPYSCRIVIHNSESDEVDFEEVIANAPDPIGNVLIDTRCLAMIDRELLDDTELLAKYQELWFGDQNKACRDLLRDNGGAVRYGFQRFGDDLKLHYLQQENVLCLAADNVEATDKPANSSTEESKEAAVEEAAA